MTPRCARLMRRYEAVHGAMPEDPLCGRRAGHNGPCRSVQALRRISARRTMTAAETCACGCGEWPTRGHRYVRGHNRRSAGGYWARAGEWSRAA